MHSTIFKNACVALSLGVWLIVTQDAVAQIQPSLSLDPESGPPGESVLASGEGFLDSPCGVRFHWDAPDGPVLGFTDVDNGAFSTCIDTPGETSPGEHVVFAQGLMPKGEFCDTAIDSGDQATAPFTVLNDIDGPFVFDPVTPYAFEGSLSDLPTVDPWQPGDPFQVGPGQPEQPCEERLSAELFEPGPSDLEWEVSAARVNPQDTSGTFSTLVVDFDGVPANGYVPPDTTGDVGPNHYIQMVNVAYAIYDKQGNILAGPTANNQLWNDPSVPLNDACRINNNGDPDVKYDALADRWVMSQFVAFTNFCVAVSQTSDPVNGGWYLYNFSTGGATNDYPKLGVWPDAYYFGTQRGFPGSGSDAWAFDRANMLNGNPAGAISFFEAGTFMLPSDLDGTTPPAAGSPNIFARHADGADVGGVDRLELRAFSVDWAVPANSTFVALPDISTAAYDRDICGLGLFGNCIPQPGTGTLLSSFTAWLLARLQYRNFGTHETLVVNHTVDVDGTDRAGSRWYELRRIAGAWSIFQQGTYSPDATNRWMGSVAMDAEGNMALGYSISSAILFPSIRYTGRLASDALGTMPQGEVTLITGAGSQTGSNRWGDYSSMNVDPVDGCTFWYTTEYYAATSTAGWRTRIGAFKFPSCGNQPPEALCADVSLEADEDCCVVVTVADIDAGSFDPDGAADIDTLCITAVDGNPVACLQQVEVCGAGPHTVTLTITDMEGESDSCTAVVTVVDTTAPVVEVGELIEIWPPNHKYHTFSLSDCVVSVEDNCDGPLDVDIVGTALSIYSDEPEDGISDGHTVNDIVILGSNSFMVRSERQGGGNGRVYGVSFEVTDNAGNTSQDICFVGVPHDQSGDPPVDDGPAAGYTVP